MHSNLLIWFISIVSVAGVITRPFKLPEAAWAATGAILMVLTRLILPAEALQGIVSGLDVYLFLVGMMLLAEVAREEKLFDWLAAHAAKQAKGSASKLFILVYVVGVIVTVLLSNDATAVVLTPAVAAVMKAAKIKNQLPYLLICAFIANAASFVLPISNPANLVIYGDHMPSLAEWFRRYLAPSAASITITFLVLRWTQKKFIAGSIPTQIEIPDLTTGAKIAALSIVVTAIALLTSSAMSIQLGLSTAICGMITFFILLLRSRKTSWIVLKGVSWSVLPLVAGLFVIVEGLNKTGLIKLFANLLQQQADVSTGKTVWTSALLVAFGCNLTNNLPAGLIAAQTLKTTHTPEIIRSAILIGVDLGPNLSVAGSLATILWLVALRREGQEITALAFFKLGLLLMTLALLGSVGMLWVV